MSLLLLLGGDGETPPDPGSPPPSPAAPVASARWSFVLLTDLSGEPIGEVTNAYDRRITWRLRRPTTAAFKVRLDDPLADQLVNGRVLVKLYETDTLRFVGDIVGAEELGDANGQYVQVTCADAFTRLANRLVGKSTEGLKYTTATDRGAMVQDIVNTLNSESDTGIRMGDVEASASDIVGPWHYKPAAEAITELCAPLDGFDWKINPIEPTADSIYPDPTPVIGELEIVAVLGSYQPEAVFEYGWGRHNTGFYKRVVSKDGMANRAFSLSPGFPDTSQGQVVSWEDQPSIADWRLRETVVPGDLMVDDFRLQLVQEHVRLRKQPRQIIEFTPIRQDADGPPVPRFGADYDIGDTVPFRVVVPSADNDVRVNAVVRVYGVQLDISPEGAEQPTLTLVEEG